MMTKLKILFIAQFYLKKELGGPKVVIELAEAINEIGHKADVVGIQEVEDYLKNNNLNLKETYALNIKTYLESKIYDYDVVDVDANNLYEYKKETKEKKPLIVARSVLFIPHLNDIKWPYKINTLGLIKAYIKKFLYGDLQKKSIDNFYKSLNVADLINVSNYKDGELLISKNYSKERIIILPYGISDTKRFFLNQSSLVPKHRNKILFLGTFDYRKGCLDIPQIFSEIKKKIPNADLTLMGTKGLYQEDEVLKFFPKSVKKFITIIPEFEESELPELLKDFRIAIFPSYLEGCPFSILELIAAGIPVIAYNSPGSSTILPNEFLVTPGDWKQIANKVSFYLKDSKSCEAAKAKLIERSKIFNWSIIATDTVNAYLKELNKDHKI
ncbi:glycosyltransferase family 4 protein [Cyclobacterium jeungdonense]|uniref:Glycosyltransferase family 4 protein n=1 Tax=Cyclobacterium jeungdonense TaxID=708087 RepID=A0ABT8CA35_9BACT|nr:glycosyltransferase family 4 protein [Cyclobacterium jeungdonense]MDN3688874.1 glycosyltransferase family 4 protein [Cyclobacterium jeungdonense]